MDRKPILTFNAPKTDGKRANLPGGGEKVMTPGMRAQASRLFPKIDSLEKQFAEYVHLSHFPAGMQPEKVLVLETASAISDLARAFSLVPGFELMGQELLSSDYQDDDFYQEKNGEKKGVIQKAYLTMSNQAGLQKLYSIWKGYVASGTVQKGYSPLKEAFEKLIDIRFWDTRDRLETTYVLDDWKYRVSDAISQGEIEKVNFEIELWFRNDERLRRCAESRLRDVIKECGGSVRSVFLHAGIGYHAILGELPISRVAEVLTNGATFLELMRCDEVMFFRPLGQCSIPVIDFSPDQLNYDSPVFKDFPEQHSKPYIALLDGLPLSNHLALDGRLHIDDADDFESLYSNPVDQIHGTSMASLIIHGDLNNVDRPLDTPLYVRPILAPGHPQMDGRRLEQIPSEFLPVDLVHRAVVRMKVGENGQAPTAPDVVIINLSVGDPYRLYDSQVSPWARMLDWLSVKYNVLFVVSAGNMPHHIKLDGVSETDLKKMSSIELQNAVVSALSKQKHERRMMSPAEAINVITVRATHSDGFKREILPNLVDVFHDPKMFSPINPITLGHKKSIKPEILMPGGRQLYINRSVLPNQDVVLKPANTCRLGPGMKSALPSNIPGSINTFGYTVGTSNAAAITTRRLAFLYETLRSLKDFGNADALSRAPEAIVLKALLVHGAEHHEDVSSVLENNLKVKGKNSKTFKSDINQYLGFGTVDEMRIHSCKDEQSTIIYTGCIKDGAAHEYKLPLPKSLAAKTVDRRLIVTVAWFSPINHQHEDYRVAQLWATPAHQLVNADSPDYYYHLLKNGTVFHEVRRGNKASSFTEKDELAIQVHCNIRAGLSGLDIPYALVVTLDAPESGLSIYDEVKQGLEEQLQQKAKAQEQTA
jgi:hypothetical protein